MIKISILMAVYNPNLKNFMLCLDSIENQSYKNYELVIIDDGTTNVNLVDILKQYSFQYIIIKNNQNLGLAKSLNIGLQHCSGKYIARMDDDDIMHINRLEKQLKIVNEKNALIFSNKNDIDYEGHIVQKNVIKVNDIKKYLLKNGNCLVHSSLFANKELLLKEGGYDERFVYAQDYALYLKLYDKCDFFMIEESLIDYRLSSNRASKMKKILSILSCYAAAIYYFSEHKNLKYFFYFIRRTLGLFKLLFTYLYK